MRFPNRPAVKISQRFCTRGHITKTSEPNEAVRTIKISKLTDDFYPQCLLAFDEFPVKEINQNITFPRVQGVLPQLNDRTAESRRSHLFRTFSHWFSHDLFLLIAIFALAGEAGLRPDRYHVG